MERKDVMDFSFGIFMCGENVNIPQFETYWL